MNRTANRAFRLLTPLVVSFAVFASLATGQVATGTPPFSSIGGGPFDAVNLGNLNVHFAIPVMHKAGRGVPFTYDISYDSSVWTPITSNGTIHWQPVYNWGWRGQTEAAVGYVSSREVDTDCWYTVGKVQYQGYEHMQVSNYVYHDAWGVSHQFNGTSNVWTGTGGGNCTLGTNNTVTSVAGDGSGYTLYANLQSGTITTKAGKVTTPPFGSGSGAASFKDANGNEITVNSSGQFFDTLSSSAPVLTVSSAAPPSATTFTYTSPAGTKSYTMNYKQYTVATNFGSTGISEYPATSVYLIDNIALPDGSKYTFAYEPTPTVPAVGKCTPIGSTTCVTARVAQITLNTGGTITYAYSGGSNGIESDGSTAGLTRTLNPGGEWQYARSLNGSTWTTLITDPTSAQNQTSINFSENANNNFYETQRQVYQGTASGTPLLTLLTCYNANFTNCSTASVANVSQTDVFRTVPNGSTTKTSLSETIYGSYGRLTSHADYDYGMTPGQAPPVGWNSLLLSYTTYVYASLGNSIVDHPSQVTVKDGQGNIKSQTTYTYDQGSLTTTSGTPQHVSITGSRGNLTTKASLTTGSSTLTTTYTYYDTGNVSTATDPNGGVTTYHYGGCGNSFLTETDLPVSGLISYLTWDSNCAGGVITQSKDVNGNSINYSYGDSNFWRPTTVGYPDGGSTTITYNEGTSSPWSIQTTSAKDSSTNVVSESVLDGFGRAVKEELTSDPNGTDEVDTTYDAVGRVASVTNPHRSTSSPTDGTTQYTYDPLNRITGITHPDNTQIAFSYVGAATQMQDEGYNSGGTSKITRIYQADGLGRTTSVCEVSSTTLKGSSGTPAACNLDISGTGFLTTYAYDPFGNITQVVQPGVNTRTFTYDGLSRITLEVSAESGTTSYTYDNTGQQGDLYQRTRPLQNQTGSATNVTTYSYDKLHRLTGISYSDGTTLWSTYAYDQSNNWGTPLSNGKGRMTGAFVCAPGNQGPNCGTINNPITGTIYSFDPVGRIAWDALCTPVDCGSGSYNLIYQYDYLGDATSVYNTAEGITYTNTYDTAARLTQLKSSLSDSNHPGTLLTVNSYNPLGEVTQATLGNGIVRSLGYDNRGRMTSLTDGSLYSFTLGYANDSNILTGNDSINGNWIQTYDSMGRLSTASKSGTAFSYQYDPAGNRWQQNVTAGSGPAPQYSFGGNNQIQGAGSGCAATTNYCYDSAGNLLNDSSYQYRYDGEGRLVSVLTTNGSSIATYTYDALGQRVQTVGTSQTNDFTFDPNGRVLDQMLGSTTWQRGEIFAGGLHLGSYNNVVTPATTYFEHADWVGSVRLRSSAGGASVETCTSLPFGDSQNCVGTDGSPLHFAALTWDPESNLHHALFRQYSTTQGRWTTSDPAGLAAVDPTNPQTWNRYAYVSDQPLTMVDPSGLIELVPPDPWDPPPFVCLESAGDCGGANPGGGNPENPGGGGGSGGGAANNGKLTPAQCQAAQTLLAREAKYGTSIAAYMSAIGFGDNTVQPFNSSNTAPINTPVGQIKIDWYTDIQATGPSFSFGVGNSIAYAEGKLIWTGLRLATGAPITNYLPFTDAAERNTLQQTFSPFSHYSDIFTPAFMQQNCGPQ